MLALPETSRSTLALLESERRANLRDALSLGYTEAFFNATYPAMLDELMAQETRETKHYIVWRIRADNSREFGLLLSQN